MAFDFTLRVFWIAILLAIPQSTQTASYTGKNAPAAVPSSEFLAQPSPKRLERGRYLVEAVGHCFQCHSQPDYAEGLGQPHPGTKGAGQIITHQSYNGEPEPEGLVCPNITPDKETGAGTWTDSQFEQAIRHGIGHDGRKLLDFMPYPFFRSMSDEDLASIIVYLRSIPAIRNPLPKTHLSFEIKINMHPELEPLLSPSAPENVRRGWYLVRIAQCNDCHTSSDPQGNAQVDFMFGGGSRFTGSWGDVVSANITSHPSGISFYDETMFIKTIRTGNSAGGVRELNHLMPFSYFRNMTDDDLKSILAFLKSVKPVQHYMDNSEPPTYCRLCRQNHGFGERN